MIKIMNKLIKYNQNLTNRVFNTHPFESNFLAPLFGILDRFDFPEFNSINTRNEKWEEDKDEFRFSCDLPRFKKEEVKVEASENNLVIKAESNKENSQYSYYREFTLPKGVDTNKISAKLEDGYLLIKIKKNEKSKMKVIDIEVIK